MTDSDSDADVVITGEGQMSVGPSDANLNHTIISSMLKIEPGDGFASVCTKERVELLDHICSSAGPMDRSMRHLVVANVLLMLGAYESEISARALEMLKMLKDGRFFTALHVQQTIGWMRSTNLWSDFECDETKATQYCRVADMLPAPLATIDLSTD